MNDVGSAAGASGARELPSPPSRSCLGQVMEREVAMAYIKSAAALGPPAALLLTLAAAPGNAQSPGASDEAAQELTENVVVTASRIPLPAEQAGASFTVLDEEYLERRQALTVEELLRGTPGVAVSRSGVLGSLSQLRIRGSEANHTLVLMDGIEIGDPALGGELDFSHFLAANLRRIEIVRGPLSALWGSDAVAGAINLISTPEVFGQSLVTHAEAGQFGTRKAGLSATSGNGEWGVRFSADHLSSDGQNISRSGNENDGYRNNTGHVIAEYNPSGQLKLRLIVRRSGSESQYDATSFLTGVPADSDRSTRRTHTVGALQAAASTLDGRWKHEAGVTRMGSKNHNFASGSEVGETSGDKTRIAYQSTFLLPRLAWKPRERRRPAFAEGGTPSLPVSSRETATLSGGVSPSITVGLEHEREDYLQRAQASPFGDPNRDLGTRSTEALAEFRLDAQDDWSASAAFRHDRNRDFDDASSWRASALKHLGAGVAVHAAYGVGVKNPTFIERFGYFSNFIGNPDLKPEQSVEYEAGHATQRFSLTYFDNRLTNEIDGFVYDPARGGFTADNRADKSRRRGVEMGYEDTFGAFRIAAYYTYVDSAEQDQTEIRRPRHQGRIDLSGRISPSIRLNVGAAAVGEQYDNDFSAFPAIRRTLDAYRLVRGMDFRISPRASLYLQLENAFDADYEDVFGYRNPGRRALAGCTLRL